MSLETITWAILILALVAANLPWLTERFFFVFSPPGGQKREWMRLLEWTVMLFVIGLIAIGFENKATGNIYPQGWEFVAIGVCLFIVFAVPGFIYRHQYKQFFGRR